MPGKIKYDVILFLGTPAARYGAVIPEKRCYHFQYGRNGMEKGQIFKTCTELFKICRKTCRKIQPVFYRRFNCYSNYVDKKYNVTSKYIPYGAEIFANKNETVLAKYDVSKFDYHMLMARMEPENNIDMILKGFHMSNSEKKFIVMGNFNNSYGKLIHEKYQ